MTATTTEERLLNLLALIAKNSQRIADSLDLLALAAAPKAPNYQRPLSEFRDFDWESINAEVLVADKHGVAQLKWNGYIFTRRSPSNNFGEAIFFTRPDGKDAEGRNRYVRLITFKAPTKARSIPEETQEKMESAPAPASVATAGNGKAPIPTSNNIKAMVANLDKPSLAVALLVNQPGNKVFTECVARFGIDQTTAGDISRECAGDWTRALTALDQHVF